MRSAKRWLVFAVAAASIACNANRSPSSNAHAKRQSAALSAPPAPADEPELLDLLGPTLANAAQRTTAHRYADLAMNDLVRDFWEGDAATGHVLPTNYGIALGQLDGWHKPASWVPAGFGGVWDLAAFYNALYTHWKLTGSAEDLQRLRSAWAFADSYFTLPAKGHEFHIGCGVEVKNEFAQDDLAWWAIFYLQAYEATGSAHALDYARAVLDCAVSPQGDVSNKNQNPVQGRGLYDVAEGGFWYKNSRGFKATYMVGMALAALWLSEVDATPTHDWRAIAEKSYQFMQAKMLRSDGIYFTEYGYPACDDANPDRTQPQGPLVGWYHDKDDSCHVAPGTWGHRYVDPSEIDNVGSKGGVSYLAGNMGIAVLAARLAKAASPANADAYRRSAAHIANAILDKETTADLVYVDDRDAWTEGAYAYSFVTEVLTLPGVLSPAISAARNTGIAVYTKDRFNGTSPNPPGVAESDRYNRSADARYGKADGIYYGGDWNGPADLAQSTWWQHNTLPQQIYTSTAAVSMIVAGAAVK